MRSPNVLRKLLLVAVGLATASLIFQACNTSPHGFGPLSWPDSDGPNPTRISPGACTVGDDACERPLFRAALNNKKYNIKAYDICYYYYSSSGSSRKQVEKMTNKANPRECEPLPPAPPAPDAIHAAHQINFAHTDDRDLFVKDMIRGSKVMIDR